MADSSAVTELTIPALIEFLGKMSSSLMDMVISILTAIAENPLLVLVCVGVPLCGIGIGFTRRLLATRA